MTKSKNITLKDVADEIEWNRLNRVPKSEWNNEIGKTFWNNLKDDLEEDEFERPLDDVSVLTDNQKAINFIKNNSLDSVIEKLNSSTSDEIGKKINLIRNDYSKIVDKKIIGELKELNYI